MNLKLYIKQTDTFRATGGQIHYDVPAGKPYNPNNLELFPGALPVSRQWPNYGSYIDITTEVSSLYKLKLTWTTERDGSGFVTPGALQQQKSASGTITFEGVAYQYLKKWLIDDVSAPLNSVDVKIEHTGCGDYFDYTIKSSDLRWCENSVCTFDVTIKQKDEVLNCIKSTLISDNHQHWFEEGGGIAKKHPRFSYCNEIRPNGQLVIQWYLMANIAFLIWLMMTSLIPIVISILGPLVFLMKTILVIAKFINKLGGSINVDGLEDTIDKLENFLNTFTSPDNFKDNIGNFFIEAAGCGREHPAPLIRDYIQNVCDKCGIKVTGNTAPVFFAQEWDIETSDKSRGNNGIIHTANPHYNACYLFPQTKKGIRRFYNMSVAGYSEPNQRDYYIQDNRPLHTLDTFLDELKLLYNAEWRVKSVYENGSYVPYLFFQRKDFFTEGPGSYIFDFADNGADRNKLLQGICFEWNERKTPAYCDGLYNTDAADSCGNEARAFMDGYVSFCNTDANPTFEGKMEKKTAFAATKFRCDGVSTDYIMDAYQVCMNGSWMSIFMGLAMQTVVRPMLEKYTEHVLLLKDETTTMPKVLIWDTDTGYENARAVRSFDLRYSEPTINPLYNQSVLGIPLPFTDLLKHHPQTFVRGSSLLWSSIFKGNTHYAEYYADATAGGAGYGVPAMLVNYPMYFEPGYYDTLWDWFHWIDDPKLKPALNQNWTAKIDLCCEDLQAEANGKRKLGVFNDAAGIALGEKVKLPFQYYPDGVITEIEVSYDPTDNLGQYIQLKGTV